MKSAANCIVVFAALMSFASVGVTEEAGHDHPSQRREGAPEERVPVTISSHAQAAVGLKTQAVTRETLSYTVRTVGSITTDQTKEARVSMRINGWIEKIHADYVGKSIKKGAPLFDLYSPELVSTQNEYLSAIKQGGALAAEVAETAMQRMRLWGVSSAEIATLRARNKAQRAVTFYSPVDGVIISKAAILGSYVTPDTELYYLADLARVWLLLTLYEADVSLVHVGDKVDVTLPYDKSKRYTGSISYIYPELDPQTRTIKARVEIDNSDGFLRPGMFANVEIKKELPDRLVIPDDAVIDTGVRQLVFVKTGDVTFEPRQVEVGPRINDQMTILSGLEMGEAVVVSASFLIDAESRMQAALRKGKSAASGHGEHGKK
ncbi:MAG: efflux RND transporter periplasmic adaptor subunit [Porticoccaceae bacterium]